MSYSKPPRLSDFINISEDHRRLLLIKWGYEIKTISVWENVSVYHNKVETVKSTMLAAIKGPGYDIVARGNKMDCEKLSLDAIFEEEIRERLTQFMIKSIL